MRSIPKTLAAVGMTAAAALTLAGCASGASSAGSSTTATAAAGAVNLAGVCPATVVVQTDWNPEADHGHLYEMVGPNPTVDAAKKTVTGDLVAGGKATGVKIQIRSGGPAIGFQSVSQQMYTDKTITLGYVSTDEALQNSVKLPTKAVFAETNISPQMIMWDPAKYPSVTDIKSLGAALSKSGGVIRYFKGAAYMSYLQGAGILPASVLDGSYDGTPAKFAAAQGKDAQQGFATAEPYVYQNEVGAWKKPVKYQLVYDTGYPIYPEAMSVRTADEQKLAPCLKKLMPVMQQADVDYVKSPSTANKLIVEPRHAVQQRLGLRPGRRGLRGEADQGPEAREQRDRRLHRRDGPDPRAEGHRPRHPDLHQGRRRTEVRDHAGRPVHQRVPEQVGHVLTARLPLPALIRPVRGQEAAGPRPHRRSTMSLPVATTSPDAVTDLAAELRELLGEKTSASRSGCGCARPPTAPACRRSSSSSCRSASPTWSRSPHPPSRSARWSRPRCGTACRSRPRGKGTGNYGQAIPMSGGLVLDVTRARAVVEVGDGVITAEAGAQMVVLEQAAWNAGQPLWMYPSTAQSTIGGFLSGGSGGTGSIEHGSNDRGFVVALDVVHADGSPDLVHVEGDEAQAYVHNYGTAGIIARATVRLEPLRDWRGLYASFADLESALPAVREIGRMQPPPRLVSADHPEISASLPPDEAVPVGPGEPARDPVGRPARGGHADHRGGRRPGRGRPRGPAGEHADQHAQLQPSDRVVPAGHRPDRRSTSRCRARPSSSGWRRSRPSTPTGCCTSRPATACRSACWPGGTSRPSRSTRGSPR